MSKDQMKKLRKAIVAAGYSKGMTVEDLRGIVERNYTGKPSLHSLSKKQAMIFLDVLNDKHRMYKGTLSHRQMWKIQNIGRHMGWYPEQKYRLIGFINKRVLTHKSIEKLEELNFDDASKVIEALKSFVRNNTKTEKIGDQEIKYVDIPDHN